MEPRSFDDLTRSLATARTRRGVLGSLAALGAGLFGARATEAQVTQAHCGNVICANNPGKCKAGCVCCTFSNGNSRCMPPGKCTGTVATTTTTPSPTTTTTTTTTAPFICPDHSSVCTDSASPGTCCGGGSTCVCPSPGECFCCPISTGVPCVSCEASQFACCSSTGVCTCCAGNRICDDGECEGAG